MSGTWRTDDRIWEAAQLTRKKVPDNETLNTGIPADWRVVGIP